jgi:PAS domain S-box-containing protein
MPIRLYKLWLNLSLHSKGIAIVSLPVVCLLVVLALVSYLQFKATDAQEAIIQTEAVLGEISALSDLAHDAETDLRVYVASASPYLAKEYPAEIKELRDRLQRLAATVKNNERQARRMQRIALDFNAVFPRTGSANPGTVHAVDPEDMKKIFILIKMFKADEQEVLRDEQELLSDRHRRVQSLAWIVGGLGLMGGIAASFLFSIGVTERLERVASNAERIAQGARFRAPDSSTDEIGCLEKRVVSASAMMLAREHELRVSRERFRIVAETLGDDIYEWDIPAGQVRVFGANTHRPPVSTQSQFLEIVHADDRQRVEREIRRHFETGDPFSEEYRVILNGSGVRHWKDEAVFLKDDDGNPSKCIGVTKDVTELRAAERANAELAAIVESIDVAVISTDNSGRVLTWNSGAERMYGYSASEMAGRNLMVLVPDDRKAQETEVLETVRAGQPVCHVETVRLTKTGATIHILATTSPTRDAGANVAGAAQVALDISELKTLQRQLSQAQKLESIGQLAAGIAHEINTPIQYIGDNAKFLEDAFQDIIGVLNARLSREQVDLNYLTAEIPTAITQLSEGVERVARIVRAMKEFSHPGPVEKTMANLNAAIESTIMVSRNEWKYVAELTADLDPNLPAVPCIVSEFNQVVLNLIVNAGHAIADSAGKNAGLGRIVVATRQAGDSAEIEVRDSGTGIPEEIRNKIFDPFFTTKEVGKGTGQGLAIAHAVIVQKHGGTLWFETEVGRGTAFFIRLPLGETL